MQPMKINWCLISKSNDQDGKDSYIFRNFEFQETGRFYLKLFKQYGLILNFLSYKLKALDSNFIDCSDAKGF
jgi:hypothetical protein